MWLGRKSGLSDDGIFGIALKDGLLRKQVGWDEGEDEDVLNNSKVDFFLLQQKNNFARMLKFRINAESRLHHFL